MTSQQRAIKQMRCEASHQIGNTPKRICHWATKSHKLVNENVSTMLGKQWYDECGIFHMHTHTNAEHKSTSSEGGRHARMPFDGKKKKKQSSESWILTDLDAGWIVLRALKKGSENAKAARREFVTTFSFNNGQNGKLLSTATGTQSKVKYL